MEFQYGTEKIAFSVESSNRKTVSITIQPDKTIIVKTPDNLSDEEILNQVRGKARWITQKLFEMREIESVKRVRQYVNGETLQYIGRNYHLQIIDSDEEIETKLIRGNLIVHSQKCDENRIKSLVKSWYIQKATEWIPKRVKYYQSYITENVQGVVIKEQKKRWGSCTKEGCLAFNWRVIMAPSNVIDYVIVHEMCHLKYMNHSTEFWDAVSAVLPDYEKRKKWLMDNGINLDL